MIDKASLLLAEDTILELMVSFAFIDGEFHPKEREALESICEEWGISRQKLESKIEEHKHKTENRENVCYKAFETIGSQYVRERLVGPLIQIATADGVDDKREAKFLSAIEEKWGLETSVGRKLSWDEDQKAVVYADCNERMIVDAGPGMGKTAVACARVSEIIKQNVSPSKIWMLSFTRTAVQEISDRISSFSEHDQSSLRVKIATVDSQAWKIRYGLTDDEIKNLFGDFDQNIEEALRLFDKKEEEIREIFYGLEHVIIDEAQDITGARAKLLIRILKFLNPNCGFTIFADLAQAIYNFADDCNDKKNAINFLDCVRNEIGKDLQEKELKTIHRTNNSNLIEIIEELRLDIYVRDNIDEALYDKKRRFVKKHADKKVGKFKPEKLTGRDNTLVLFRRRPEVLLASSFACKDGVAHRVRMSRHSSGIFSWIGVVFCDYPERIISKERFFEICDRKADLFESPVCSSIYEKWWSLLLLIAKKDVAIDLTQLRTILSRNRPPVNFCYPDAGSKGPILGTIHASKGREADNVELRLPSKSQKTNYDEELRVLYVGATRAREELSVGKGFIGQSFAKSLESGRAYDRYTNKDSHKYRLAAVEIGLNGDLNEYSLVSQKRSYREITDSQKKLTELAKKSPYPLTTMLRKYEDGDRYTYYIWTCSKGKETDKILGEFNASFNSDLFRIADSFGKFKPPKDIDRYPFYMLGLHTICKSENDPQLETAHEPYSRTGFWVAPTLIGYPCCLFPAR